MCACRLEESSMQLPSASHLARANSAYDLEDYIQEMETRAANYEAGLDQGDVYVQLAQKEKDLILAAEVGKALLEKNQDLKLTNERLSEQLTQKIELAEQEKHALRRKLESLDGEYDAKMAEMQTDISQLRNELDHRQQAVKYSEKERVSLVHELTEQNQRLTEQLKKASQAEEQLANQMKNLREQFNTRRSNMSDHVSQLELLREEINIITEKKADLERRIMNLAEERDSISLTLDETTDRIIMLERLTREQELKIRGQERDLEELRHTNSHLQERVEFLSRRSSTPASLAHTSLLNEIEMSEDDVLQSAIDADNDDDIECDDMSSMIGGTPGHEDFVKLREEVLDVYIQMRNMCLQMKHRKSTPSISSVSSEEIGQADVKVGLLSEVLRQLKGLLHDVLRREAKGNCSACGRGPTEREDLERELNISREELIKTQRKLTEKTEDIRRKNDAILDLNGRINIQQIEMKNVMDERDLLRRDIANSALSSDEIVNNAWQNRDKAISRKNAVEVELARTRIDVMHVNSQLIEAIQQKLELSQQLEMWQVDMQTLLDEQMQKKLNQQEKHETMITEDSDSGHTSGSGATLTSSKGKLFGIWR